MNNKVTSPLFLVLTCLVIALSSSLLLGAPQRGGASQGVWSVGDSTPSQQIAKPSSETTYRVTNETGNPVTVSVEGEEDVTLEGNNSTDVVVPAGKKLTIEATATGNPPGQGPEYYSANGTYDIV